MTYDVLMGTLNLLARSLARSLTHSLTHSLCIGNQVETIQHLDGDNRERPGNHCRGSTGTGCCM